MCPTPGRLEGGEHLLNRVNGILEQLKLLMTYKMDLLKCPSMYLEQFITEASCGRIFCGAREQLLVSRA